MRTIRLYFYNEDDLLNVELNKLRAQIYKFIYYKFPYIVSFNKNKHTNIK